MISKNKRSTKPEDKTSSRTIETKRPTGRFFTLVLRLGLKRGCPVNFTPKKKMIKILFIWLTGISFFDVIGVAIKVKAK